MDEKTPEEKVRELEKLKSTIAEKQQAADSIMKDMDTKTEISLITQQVQELKATEARMDKKLFEYKQLVERDILGGKSLGNQPAPASELPQDKLKRETKEYFKGTPVEEFIK